jgi:type II secretory pathway pseudopilin PulG
MPAWVIPAAILAAKAAKSYFGNKAKKKQNTNQRNAAVAGLTFQQKQREDARRARLKLGGSMMNSIPATTAGGSVNTNMGIDPALLEQLGIERTYDFGSAVPDYNAGAGSAFLSGLFGDVGDTLGYMYGMGGAGGGTTPWADVSNGAGSAYPARFPSVGNNIMGQNAALQFADDRNAGAGGVPMTVNWEDLFGTGG